MGMLCVVWTTVKGHDVAVITPKNRDSEETLG